MLRHIRTSATWHYLALLDPKSSSPFLLKHGQKLRQTSTNFGPGEWSEAPHHDLTQLSDQAQAFSKNSKALAQEFVVQITRDLSRKGTCLKLVDS